MRRHGRALVSPILALAATTLAPAAAFAQPVRAPHPPADSYVLRGIVTDIAGRPITGAEVVLTTVVHHTRATRSGSDGRFEFRGLPAEPIAVRARRIGYGADTIRLRPDTARPLVFVLRVVPTDIDPIVVHGETDDYTGRLAEFYEHKRVRNRFGYFFERAEIERRSPTHLSEMLRPLRGVQLVPDGLVGNKVRLRGCRPMVWLNGLRMLDAELDEVAHPDEVAGLEIYVSMTGMPARFVDLVGKCGAVVIWTR